MKNLKKAFEILTGRERRQCMLIACAVVVIAVFEIVSIASVMPFLSLLASPSAIDNNIWVQRISELFGVSGSQDILLALGALSFAVLVLSALVRTIGFYVIQRFIEMRRHSLSTRMLKIYVSHPYSFFLSKDTSELSMNLLSEVEAVVGSFFSPLVQLLAQSFMLIAILTLIVVLDPMVAIVTGLALGTSYLSLFIFCRRRIERLANQRINANRGRFSASDKIFGGIKEIKVLGKENAYLREFDEPSREFSHAIYASNFIGGLPKFVIEAIAFGGILLISMMLMVQYGGHQDGALEQILPLLGVYAFAAQRMLPAIQSIYQSISQLKFGVPSLNTLYRELVKEDVRELLPTHQSKLQFHDSIEFRNVNYSYPESEKTDLSGICLKIRAGEKLGIVGTTGSGKTTLVDIFLGLLRPSSGHILVDGTELNQGNVRSWQTRIGYVPQDVFLTHDSILQNIALGVPTAEIDVERALAAARHAQISNFVETNLPQGYDTRAGVRGARLSGGQVQRIGLARALYLEPTLLVLDEATSALDHFTEAKVMNSIESLSKELTTIIIAHRLSTLRSCDRIIKLDGGKISWSGNYEQLIELEHSDPASPSNTKSEPTKCSGQTND